MVIESSANLAIAISLSSISETTAAAKVSLTDVACKVVPSILPNEPVESIELLTLLLKNPPLACKLVLELISPSTCNVDVGVVVPIPTCPLDETNILVWFPVCAFTLNSPEPVAWLLSICTSTLLLSFICNLSSITVNVASPYVPLPSSMNIDFETNKSPLALISPATCNFFVGVMTPIPTFPVWKKCGPEPVICIEPVNLWMSSAELPKILLPLFTVISWVINSSAVILPSITTSPLNFEVPVTKSFELVISPLALMFPLAVMFCVTILVNSVSTVVWVEEVAWRTTDAVIVSTVKLFKFLMLNVVSSEAFIS